MTEPRQQLRDAQSALRQASSNLDDARRAAQRGAVLSIALIGEREQLRAEDRRAAAARVASIEGWAKGAAATPVTDEAGASVDAIAAIETKSIAAQKASESLAAQAAQAARFRDQADLIVEQAVCRVLADEGERLAEVLREARRVVWKAEDRLKALVDVSVPARGGGAPWRPSWPAVVMAVLGDDSRPIASPAAWAARWRAYAAALIADADAEVALVDDGEAYRETALEEHNRVSRSLFVS